MATTFRQYDPGLVVVSFKGVRLKGYAPDTFVKAMRAVDGYKKEVGVAGDVTRTRVNDRSGEVSVTLMKASPTNDILSLFANTDENTNEGHGELQVEDLLGNLLMHADTAWIRKYPEVELGGDSGTFEWVFDCAELFIRAGGSVTE